MTARPGAEARRTPDYPAAAVPFTAVSLRDPFWRPRLETNRTVTIPSVLRKCEEFGRVDNFRRAAGLLPGPYAGVMPFEDTDVYKAVEGASLSLACHPDPRLSGVVDGLVGLIEAAQEPDGYLYTSRTIDPARPLPDAGPARWSSLAMSHELYNSGHLFDAACAHRLATGSDRLLAVALRNARLLSRVFGPDGRHDACGHPIVEMGLARLSRLTGDRSLLELARFFLEQRGRHETRPRYEYADNPAYCQDHMPVLRQREAAGHAVRAVYLYCGMADVAAGIPDPAYAGALREIWKDVTRSKIYLTGGLGARHDGEAFGAVGELPNRTAYAETCASIGSVMWNQRMFLLTGDSAYVDVLEQTLYNSLAAGVSLGGNEFFYTNPLESDGQYAFNHGSAGRQPWFQVSCCPTGLCRFLPSLPGYQYATAGNALYVNLFMAGGASVEIAGTRFALEMDTAYPWSGDVRLRLEPSRRARARVHMRIPGWSIGRILGGALYGFEGAPPEPPVLRLNGVVQLPDMEKGYAVVDRTWDRGDTLELSLPLRARTVSCDPMVADNRGKAAIQRGPVVYCVEGRDADVPLDSLTVGPETSLVESWEPGLLGGITVLRGPGFNAIPYCTWANRGPGPMRVWLGHAT